MISGWKMSLGIFSFDLASAGLHKVKEYYSSLFKATVDPNDVETIQDGKRIYETRMIAQTIHDCEQALKGDDEDKLWVWYQYQNR